MPDLEDTALIDSPGGFRYWVILRFIDLVGRSEYVHNEESNTVKVLPKKGKMNKRWFDLE
jgi:hypothetical protein